MLESIQTAKNRPEKHAGWNDSIPSWTDSSEPKMKINTIQISYESIQVQVREFCETIQIEKRWFIHESIQVDVNRFTWSQRLHWIDSDCI